MALTSNLYPGFSYRIKADQRGAGEIVTVVSNKTFPDGHPDARKLPVRFQDGTLVNILPRQLEDQPVLVPEFVSTSAEIQADVVTEALVDLIAEAKAEAAIVGTLPPPPPPAPLPLVADVVAPLVMVAGRVLNPIVDPMDDRLDHLRPERSKVKRYINRVMSNGMTDVEFLLIFASDPYRIANEGHPTNIALKGDTQSGKTFLVEALAVAWADALHMPKVMPIFTISGSSGVTDFDLFGQTTSYTDPDTGIESLVWLPGIVELAAQCGGILYLDEMNAMGERVTSSLHPVIDHRHAFVNRNKPEWRDGQFMPSVVDTSLDTWVVATYNEGYRGMGKMNQAFAQRFEHILWDYDPAVENRLIKSPTVRLLGEALRNARKASEIQTPVGTSALQRIQRNVVAMGAELAMSTLLGMFDPSERDVVQAIITDRTIVDMLKSEQIAAEA